MTVPDCPLCDNTGICLGCGKRCPRKCEPGTAADRGRLIAAGLAGDDR
jgi:hypothetical protein